MIKISNDLHLIPITNSNKSELLPLMKIIYPPVYKTYWKQGCCDFYFSTFFSDTNITEELNVPNTFYYFVIYNTKTVGIIKYNHNYPCEDYPKVKATYLHRLYLDTTVHSKGIGAQLVDYAIAESLKQNSEILWLEAMERQKQALHFYLKTGFTVSKKIQIPFKLIKNEYKAMQRMCLNLY